MNNGKREHLEILVFDTIDLWVVKNIDYTSYSRNVLYAFQINIFYEVYHDRYYSCAEI